jgi:hypothetical protein
VYLYNGDVKAGEEYDYCYGPITVSDSQVWPYQDAWTYYNIYGYPIEGYSYYIDLIDRTMDELNANESVWVIPWVYDFSGDLETPIGQMNLICDIQ